MLRVFSPADDQTEPSTGAQPCQNTPAGPVRGLVVYSSVLREVLERAKRVARSKVPVLIHGESGTGKELFARLVHECSERKGKPFIQINCAAFTESLIESEMFGHEKGAFTGAEQRHSGYFERAHEGSLLLDEIGEMPPRQQAKLLRVLEEEAFERVGGEQKLRVDVRIIATTNRDLEAEAVRGNFREDLYYRLNAVSLQVPPLRSRVEDIPPLVRYFIERFSREGPEHVNAIDQTALDSLLAYSWPGNVRQLRNVIHYACVLATSNCITAEDLPPLRDAPGLSERAEVTPTLADIERELIQKTLREVGGNRTAAALRLGITVRTLQNKLKRYREADAA